MIVCIAEKPSVARDLAEILGAKNRKDGYLEGNGYAVTWVYGHLCSLKDPEDYNPNWKYWKLEDLPIIPAQFGIKLRGDINVCLLGDPAAKAWCGTARHGTVWHSIA